MDPKKDKTPVAGGANKSPASGGKRPATGSQTTPPVKATCSQTAAMKATVVESLGDSPSKKRKPTNPAPKKVESRPEEEAPPVPPPVPGPAEEKPAGDDGPKEGKEAGGSSGGGANLEDDAAKRDKGKAVAEGDGEEEADQDDDAGLKDGGDGEPQPGGGGAAPAERTIIIEHRRKGRKLFKQRADELNPGLEIAVPGITVLLNHEFPAGQDPGQIKISSEGIQWKEQGGGKAVKVDKSDVLRLSWTKIPRTNQLGVQTKAGSYYKFAGFSDQDVSRLNTFFQSNFGKTPEEKQLSVSGHNWGEVDLSGNSKQAFEVPLADVSQTKIQGKTDVALGFHVDDITGANAKDSLVEMSFHIPDSNSQFKGDDNSLTQKALQTLLSHHNFDLKTIRRLICLFADNSGNISPKVVKEVSDCVESWKGSFEWVNKDRMEGIDTRQLKEALSRIGLQDGHRLLAPVLPEFGNKPIDYHCFIECCLTVKEHPSGYQGTAAAPPVEVEDLDSLDEFMMDLPQVESDSCEVDRGRFFQGEEVDELNAGFLKSFKKAPAVQKPIAGHSTSSFMKCFYREVDEIRKMTGEEVCARRRELKVKVRGEHVPKPIRRWQQAGLNDKVVQVLRRNSLKQPVSMAAQAVPVIMSGRDCLGIGRDGHHLNLSFILPMLRHVKLQPPVEKREGPIGIVIAPTPNSVQKIHKQVEAYAKAFGLRSGAVCGESRRGKEVVVGTPGSILHMQGLLQRVTFLVVAEAHLLRGEKCMDKVRAVFNAIRPDRQVVIICCTFSAEVEDLARRMNQRVVIEDISEDEQDGE